MQSPEIEISRDSISTTNRARRDSLEEAAPQLRSLLLIAEGGIDHWFDALGLDSFGLQERLQRSVQLGSGRRQNSLHLERLSKLFGRVV